MAKKAIRYIPDIPVDKPPEFSSHNAALMYEVKWKAAQSLTKLFEDNPDFYIREGSGVDEIVEILKANADVVIHSLSTFTNDPACLQKSAFYASVSKAFELAKTSPQLPITDLYNMCYQTYYLGKKK